MGLEGRDYMREDAGRRALSGGWAVLPISHKLIVLNLLVFVLWQVPGLEGFMSDQFTVGGPGLLERGRVWTLFTAAFSHQGFTHLLWNMLFLYWFGPDLETIYGKRNFLLLYLYGALVSSLAHVAWERGWGHDVPALGASGAVMAVVVTTALFFPHRTILMMFVVPVPLWLLACLKLAGDLSGLASGAGGVAHAGHLGGAAAGLAFKQLDLRLFASPGQLEREGWRWPGLRRLIGRLWPRPALRVLPPLPSSDAPDPVDPVDPVDELLRKIARDGIDSLTAEERAFLERASERYRRG